MKRAMKDGAVKGDDGQVSNLVTNLFSRMRLNVTRAKNHIENIRQKEKEQKRFLVDCEILYKFNGPCCSIINRLVNKHNIVQLRPIYFASFFSLERLDIDTLEY